MFFLVQRECDGMLLESLPHRTRRGSRAAVDLPSVAPMKDGDGQEGRHGRERWREEKGKGERKGKECRATNDE